MKKEKAIVLVALVLGLGVCVVDILLDAYVFYQGTLWELAFTNVPKHEIYFRAVVLTSLFLLGIVASRTLAKLIFYTSKS